MADQPPGKTPARRPRISREFLEQHRRRRYVEASAELLHESGRGGARVTEIVARAGTARNSFYEVFQNAEDCIAYGIGLGAQELFVTLEAQDGEGEWPEELDAAIAGFYGAVAAAPRLAELFLIHSAGSRVDHGRRAAAVGAERFAALLGRGRVRAEAQGRRPPPPSAEEYFARAIIALAAARVRGAAETLPAQSRATAALVGGYYLAPEAAERVLVAPPASELLRP